MDDNTNEQTHSQQSNPDGNQSDHTYSDPSFNHIGKGYYTDNNQNSSQYSNQQFNQNTNQQFNQNANQQFNQYSNQQFNQNTNQNTNQQFNQNTNQNTNSGYYGGNNNNSSYGTGNYQNGPYNSSYNNGPYNNGPYNGSYNNGPNNNGAYNNGPYSNGNFNNSNFNNGSYNNGYQKDPSAPNFILYLVLGIIITLFQPFLLGISIIVLSILGNNDFKQGNIGEYEKKYKTTKILLIIGGIIIALSIIWGVIFNSFPFFSVNYYFKWWYN